MRITANTKAVQLIDSEEFLSGAYNDITIDVELSEEYRSLTSFVTFNDKKTPVIAGKVSTPCLSEGLCRIGVYAVNIDDNNVVLRYSPKPVDVLITTGTWNNRIAESDAPTASEAEKIYTLIDNAIAAGQLKGDKGESFKYSDFTPEQLESLRGPQGKTGPKGDSYILTDADKTEIAQKVKLPTKTSDLTNDSNFVSDVNYIHTDNNFTTDEKQKLSALANYDDTALQEKVAGKQDKLTAGENITIENNVISANVVTDYDGLTNQPIKNLALSMTEHTMLTDIADGCYIVTEQGYIKTTNGYLRALAVGTELIVVTYNGIKAATYQSGRALAFFNDDMTANDKQLTVLNTSHMDSQITEGATDDTVPTSKAVKNYVDNLATNKIDKSQVGNGLKFENGQLQLDIPVASASTTYGGDAQ